LLAQPPFRTNPHPYRCRTKWTATGSPASTFGVFERELRDRRDWCENNTTGAYEVGPIGPDPERLTGRRFKFANQRDAALFKLFFSTDLWP
jgi:hypothetical protein